MNLDKVGYAWSCDPYSGWGVIGINYSKYWPGEANAVLRGAHDFPVFVAMGNDWIELATGKPSIACPVFELPASVAAYAARFADYSIVISASRWNRDMLAEMGVESRMVHQGYDPELFHPGIRKPRTDGRFRVFSGGKAEWRKGQDHVLQGFKIFAEKHDDVVLHAAWGSPWPHLAQTLAETELGAPPGSPGGLPNFAAWAQKVGIRRHQFEIVPMTANHLMPDVLANMDCAVFASRLEGGTNIAAMECIGAGIPTLLSWTTGHKDLPHHYTLTPCTPETIAEGLECVYQSEPRPHVEAINEFTWPVRIAELVGVLKDA